MNCIATQRKHCKRQLRKIARSGNRIPVQKYRLGNNIESVTLELDESASIISYEEYYPYGDTSYQAGRSVSEISQKRYRYTGKEKDEESGLYYFGARYYACWLGLWASTDPEKQFASGYLYAGNGFNPLSGVDGDGREIIADNDRDQQLYAKFKKESIEKNPEIVLENGKKISLVKILHELEQSDVIFNWHVTDEPIDIPDINKKALGEFKPSGDGSKREFDVNIYIEDLKKSGLHELLGHGKQANKFLQENPSSTAADWRTHYEGKLVELEQEAHEIAGEKLSKEEIKERYKSIINRLKRSKIIMITL